MPGKNKSNLGRIKFMYLYTIIGAGGFGLGILLIPETMKSLLRWPDQDPIVFGVSGAVYLGFALVSLFGLRSPLKFSANTELGRESTKKQREEYTCNI